MKTREEPPGAVTPGELALSPGQVPEVNDAGQMPPAAQVPRPIDTPAATVPGPGMALAGARVPAGPTVPDWEPSALTALVSRLANDLFVEAPPAAPTPATSAASAPSPLSASIPGQPSAVTAASPPAAPSVPAQPSASAPTEPTIASAPPVASAAPAPLDVSPFSAAPSFAGLDDIGALTIGALPLLEEVPGAGTDLALPYWLTVPAEDGATEPTGTAAAYEIEPTGVLRPLPGGIFDPHAIRHEFPILQERVNGRRLVWLDNAATTQKPRVVIDRLSHYYEHENSNVHRAAHTLAARSTDAYESARETARRFLNAPSSSEIVFVRGTTEGINLVAQSWGRRNVGADDEVVITWLEHHANIVPWQQLCSEKGARLRVAPVDDDGQVILSEYEKLLGPRTRLVAFSQVSNALGTVTPAREMIELAHRHGAKVLLDGAQAVSHMSVDVQALDCDFFVLSGHKVFGPTGIGVVFGKRRILEAMPPWQGGGNMIRDVTFERTLFQDPPARFEAGTPNVADAIGLGTALDWLSRIGLENVSRYEHSLLSYATERLLTVPGLTMIGTTPDKAAVLSFVLAGQRTDDVGGLLDKEGIAVRSGHHCAQPILRRFGLEATVRASLALYNTCEDIDELVAALYRLQAGHGGVR